MGDRRIKYSKMVLKESLLKLMTDKPINKITIKEICELADVNRGTFYAHYNDQYDLLRQIQDEFADEVKELKEKKETKVMSSVEMITELVSYFGEQRSLCKIIFNTTGDYELINKLMDNAYVSFLDEWRQKLKNVSETQMEMLYMFISNGSAAIIRHWVLGDMEETPKEVAKFIMQVSNYGSNSFVK